MKVVAVDDEKIILNGLLKILYKILPNDEVVGFDNSLDALDYIKNNYCEVAILDISMPGMNGLELGLNFKKIIQILILFS